MNLIPDWKKIKNCYSLRFGAFEITIIPVGIEFKWQFRFMDQLMPYPGDVTYVDYQKPTLEEAQITGLRHALPILREISGAQRRFDGAAIREHYQCWEAQLVLAKDTVTPGGFDHPLREGIEHALAQAGVPKVVLASRFRADLDWSLIDEWTLVQNEQGVVAPRIPHP